MHLDNATGVPAEVTVAEVPDDPNRVGLLTAKATFKFDSAGLVLLDTQNPFPIFREDQPTPLGPLPADNRARRGDKLEVMLLGNAHPPRGGVPHTKVALSVGDVRRELSVFGDRFWVGPDIARASISAPKPFDVMPLVYERAFGGTVPVKIDARSTLDIAHPINPSGKGFDARPQADGLGKALRAPAGFPALPHDPRPLPNIESPLAPITRWQDAPDPAGWAPAPAGSSIAFMPAIQQHLELVGRMQQQGWTSERIQAELEAKASVEDPDTWLYRAHPDWVIPLPPANAWVRMENLRPGAPLVQFQLPRLRLSADYVLYDRQGQRDLRPQVMVLLPEQKRFYLVYRLPFHFQAGPSHERSFRLRAGLGWPPS